ncbi:MAG: phosphoribosyl-AMP cyclohydrolase [Alphaproteobacteria bacterium]|nr:phosphoribosyl-AMP cyclohydrolase [Alphaproteobacteria bacterium]
MSKPAFPEPGNKSALEEGTAFTPKFDAHGLLPAIVTDARTGEVLMFAYMNDEALARTIETGEAHFWSRSRGTLWRKGETSGNAQRVVEMRTDCDQDALWLKVEMMGKAAACHTGRRTCFYRAVPVGEAPAKGLTLRWMDAEREFDPEAVYNRPDDTKGR